MSEEPLFEIEDILSENEEPKKDESPKSEYEEEEFEEEMRSIEFEIPVQPFNQTDNVMEFLYVINQKIDSLREDVINTLKSIDVKKIKKNRTPNKRCTYINRRGERCKGYYCKTSMSLCYAHHNIVKKTLKKTPFLYGSEKRA